MKHFHKSHGHHKLKLAGIKRSFKTIVFPRWRLLLLGLLLIVVNRFASLVLPASTKYFIDRVLAEHNMELLKQLMIGVGAAVCIQAVSSFFLTRLLSVEAYHLIYQLRLKVQKHVIRQPIAYFDNNRSGALVSRIMNDVEGIRNLVGRGLVQLVGGFLTAGVALVLLLKINIFLTAISFLPVLLFSVISLFAFSYLRPIFRKRSEILAEVTARLTESLNGIRIVRGFNAERREEKTFKEGANRLFTTIRKTLTATSFIVSAGIFVIGATSLTIMGLGGMLILKGEMTVGDFVSFIFLLGFLVAPILQITNVGTQLTEAFAGLDRMEEVLTLPLEGQEPERIHSPHAIKGAIRFDQVSFSYEKGEEIIHNLSLEILSGSVTALVGSSGSGKTTIAGLAASFLKPTKGIISIDNMDISTIKLESYRSRLGVVLQDDFLFEGTIRENLLFTRPKVNEETLLAAVKAAHIDEFSDGFEKGLDTIIGERGVKLSGGQRQRVAIGRALIADPSVLILDEATSSLDSENEMLIQKSLDFLLKGRTTIVIAHRLSTIKRADQILVVEGGRVVEKGRHEFLLQTGGRYHELYTLQARI
ncbi:MAG: ABC transporter ATP-binding protein [Fibrobacteria bacterium]|nr:ABC transporter ATP-binding protein [Fibrobacteria bacterium]